MARGQLGNGRGLPGQQRGGIAHIEPFGKMPGGRDAAERAIEPVKLLWVTRPSASSAANRCVITPSSLSGDAGVKRAKQRRKTIRARALAAHAGVDFQMNGNQSGRNARGVRSRLKLVKLPRLPRNGGQPVADRPRPGREKRRRWPECAAHSARYTVRDSARAATPSSTLVTPSQRAPARTAAGAQRASEWP